MKKRRDGFTLIELLVVMAIIAILAAIVVPNVAQYIAKGRVTRALSECQSIELALTKMLADASRGNLGDLFNGARVNALAEDMMTGPLDWFAKATKIYTNTVYALLREGRGVLGKEDPNCTDPDTSICPTLIDKELGFQYALVLDTMAVKKLGTSYLDIGFDPWGNMYNIFPGPWSLRWGLSPFRVYMPESTEEKSLPGRATVSDGLTVTEMDDPDTGETGLTIGFPASRNQMAFIWSNGANLRSSQAVYNLVRLGLKPVYGDGPARENVNFYDPQQDGLFAGGGDDINNWDQNQSWSRFYN